MSLDPEKLQAALEALEAEKERRDEEKIASGEAVVHIDVCSPGNEDRRTHDASGRELIHLRVHTGVPRGIDDSDDADTPEAKPEPKSYMHQRYEPIRPAPPDKSEPLESLAIAIRV